MHIIISSHIFIYLIYIYKISRQYIGWALKYSISWLKFNLSFRVCVCRWFWELECGRTYEHSSVQQHRCHLCSCIQQHSPPVDCCGNTGRRRSCESSQTFKHFWFICLPISTHKQAHTHWYTWLNLNVSVLYAPESASVPGWRLRRNTGLTHVVLPWPADSASECDSHRNPDLSQLLHCHLHEDWWFTEGTWAPQHHHAEPHQYICWWDTRSVGVATKRVKDSFEDKHFFF